MQITKFAALLVSNAVFVVLWPGEVPAAKFKTITLDPTYEHDRFETKVTGLQDRTLGNHLRKFRAYITLFDGEDDDNGDGEPDFLGIPHFVAYEIKRIDRPLAKGPPRPSSWITDKDLSRRGIAPSDATYRYSKAFLTANKKHGTGGKIVKLKNVVQTGRHNHKGSTGKTRKPETMDRNPEHWKNQTRNLRIAGRNQLRKCHVRLITELNGMQVIW